MSRPVLLDTDLGSDVDDAIALALLLACPELRLVAVTTVAGDVAGRAQAAARLLGAAGRSDVDVCVGACDALARSKRFNADAIPLEVYPPGPAAPVAGEPAAERIVRAARETPGLELVAIGPTRLVTADVTLQVWLREADLARLAVAKRPATRALPPLVRLWTPVQQRIFVDQLGGTLADDNVAFLHDPLTVLAAVDESALRFERLRIVPTIEAGVLRTHEVSDAAGLGAWMEVATEVDAAAAREQMLARLLSAS